MACQSIGAKYTQNVFSSLALSKELFPDIVMLPYPFELNDGDILKTMPTPEGSHLWALGYALDKIHADGGHYTPSIFMAHDKGHLAEMIWSLSFASNIFINNQEHYVPPVEEVWRNNKEGRKLYYAALKRVQAMASEYKNDEQTRMNTFFGFLAFHEGATTLSSRLHSFIAGYGDLTRKASFKNLKDPHYYLNLLADSLKGMNYSEFMDAYVLYIKQFLKDFSERDQDSALMESIRKWVGSGKLTIDTFSSQTIQNKKFQSYSIVTPMFGYETKNMQTNVENYVQLPNDPQRLDMLETLRKYPPGSTYQRYYFLGSPFYQDEAPPKFVKETLGF